MYLKLDESKWYRHTQEWSDRLEGTGKVEVYKGQIEVAADVAPVVHAHWIYEIDDLFPADSMMICSNCGEYERLGANDNYCGNCGAKMDEVPNEY